VARRREHPAGQLPRQQPPPGHSRRAVPTPRPRRPRNRDHVAPGMSCNQPSLAPSGVHGPARAPGPMPAGKRATAALFNSVSISRATPFPLDMNGRIHIVCLLTRWPVGSARRDTRPPACPGSASPRLAPACRPRPGLPASPRPAGLAPACRPAPARPGLPACPGPPALPARRPSPARPAGRDQHGSVNDHRGVLPAGRLLTCGVCLAQCDADRLAMRRPLLVRLARPTSAVPSALPRSVRVRRLVSIAGRRPQPWLSRSN
jgi:hypothetical protein